MVILDPQVLGSIGDPGVVGVHRVSRTPRYSIFTFEVDPADPPALYRGWIFLRGSDRAALWHGSPGQR